MIISTLHQILRNEQFQKVKQKIASAVRQNVANTPQNRISSSSEAEGR